MNTEKYRRTTQKNTKEHLKLKSEQNLDVYE